MTTTTTPPPLPVVLGFATLEAAVPPSVPFPLPLFPPVHVCPPRSGRAPAALLSLPRAFLLPEIRSDHSVRAHTSDGGENRVGKHSTYPVVVAPPLSLPPWPLNLPLSSLRPIHSTHPVSSPHVYRGRFDQIHAYAPCRPFVSVPRSTWPPPPP
jgi:hypothetical protein